MNSYDKEIDALIKSATIGCLEEEARQLLDEIIVQCMSLRLES